MRPWDNYPIHQERRIALEHVHDSFTIVYRWHRRGRRLGTKISDVRCSQAHSASPGPGQRVYPSPAHPHHEPRLHQAGSPARLTRTAMVSVRFCPDRPGSPQSHLEPPLHQHRIIPLTRCEDGPGADMAASPSNRSRSLLIHGLPSLDHEDRAGGRGAHDQPDRRCCPSTGPPPLSGSPADPESTSESTLRATGTGGCPSRGR